MIYCYKFYCFFLILWNRQCLTFKSVKSPIWTYHCPTILEMCGYLIASNVNIFMFVTISCILFVCNRGILWMTHFTKTAVRYFSWSEVKVRPIQSGWLGDNGSTMHSITVLCVWCLSTVTTDSVIRLRKFCLNGLLGRMAFLPQCTFKTSFICS